MLSRWVARWLSGRASDLRSRQVVHTLLPLSPSSIIWYQRKLGSKQAYRVVHHPVSRGLAVFADAWLLGWLAEISADLWETVAHQSASRRCAIQIHVLYFTLLYSEEGPGRAAAPPSPLLAVLIKTTKGVKMYMKYKNVGSSYRTFAN